MSDHAVQREKDEMIPRWRMNERQAGRQARGRANGLWKHLDIRTGLAVEEGVGPVGRTVAAKSCWRGPGKEVETGVTEDTGAGTKHPSFFLALHCEVVMIEHLSVLADGQSRWES